MALSLDARYLFTGCAGGSVICTELVQTIETDDGAVKVPTNECPEKIEAKMEGKTNLKITKKFLFSFKKFFCRSCFVFGLWICKNYHDFIVPNEPGFRSVWCDTGQPSLFCPLGLHTEIRMQMDVPQPEIFPASWLSFFRSCNLKLIPRFRHGESEKTTAGKAFFTVVFEGSCCGPFWGLENIWIL